MLSNPTPSGLQARQQHHRQHRRQNSTPTAFDQLKIATDLPAGMHHRPQPQQRPRMTHRRGAMSLDLRRQQMHSPTTLRQEFSTVSNSTNNAGINAPQHVLREAQQQRIARPGPQQAFANLASDENYVMSPHGTPHLESFEAQCFDGLRNQQDLGMSFDMYGSPMNHRMKKGQENSSEPGNMPPSQECELFPSSAMSTPTFLNFQESPTGAPGWISDSDTTSTRRSSGRRISNGILDRVSKFENMGDAPSRPLTPPQQNVTSCFPISPMDTPHDRTIKHSQRPQRFDEGYDESMEETIKPTRQTNRRTKTTFDEMRRAAENRPIMPTPPRANTMPMPGAFEPPKDVFQNMHHPNMSVQTQFNGPSFHGPSSSQPQSAVSEFSHHPSPTTQHMGEFSSAFDVKPDLHPHGPGADGSDADSPGTDKTSQRGSPHRRTESVASLASAASIATIDIEKTKTETGITLDDIQQYIQGPDPRDNKWVCTFDECGKRFGRKENIKSHVQTHLNDRQYQCPTCHKCFVRQHDLKRHAKIHTGIKPYPCECGNSFARHDALTRHKQRGMCIGAFDGIVRKVVKRGRPRKHRPDMDERKDKSARTRRKNGSTKSTASSASSQSGYSDSSAVNSPEHEQDHEYEHKHMDPDFDMLDDIMDVSIGGTTMDPSNLQGLCSSSSAPMPTLSTDPSTAGNSPSTTSVHTYVSQLSHLSLHPEVGGLEVPATGMAAATAASSSTSPQPGSPAKSATSASRCNEPPELSQSSSPPPLACTQYIDLDPGCSSSFSTVASTCAESLMMSATTCAAEDSDTLPSLAGLGDGGADDDDILLQFTHGDPNMLMLGSDAKFDGVFDDAVDMFVHSDDLFFNAN